MTSSSRRLFHVLAPMLGLASSGFLAAADPIETIGKTATELVRTRTETVRLENDWGSQRQILESTVSALEQRAQNLEDQRELLKAKSAKEREELEFVEAKNQTAREGLDQVEARLKELTGTLLQLRPSLPPRLSAALEMPYRSIAGTESTPSERMQLTMTILNRCVQFNRMISSGEEVVTVDGEPAPRSLEVIYWGLSHGYALDRAGGKAWFGSPGPQGWRWASQLDAVKSVTRLLAVYNGKSDPELVAVPVTLGHIRGETAKK